MTDKEIIIDGVNITECEYFWNIGDAEGLKICKINFDDNYFSNGIPCGERCKKHPDCYFKQLTRKTQECEELKNQLIQKDEVNTFFNTPIEGWDNDSCKICESKQNYDQLKAENESLKESLKMFSSTLDWALKSQVGLYKRQIDSSVPDDWEYEEVLVLIEQYIDKLKQTLTEIKEIAEDYCVFCPKINPETFDMSECKKCNHSKILQKISESEVKNENRKRN